MVSLPSRLPGPAGVQGVRIECGHEVLSPADLANAGLIIAGTG